MVRLMLALTPVVCVSAAIAVSSLLDTFVDLQEPVPQGNEIQVVTPNSKTDGTAKKIKKSIPPPVRKSSKRNGVFGLDTRLGVIINTAFLLLIFVLHCTWVTSNFYSSPSVVLASKNPDGSQNIIDDFREAYYWIRENTPQDTVVMSWWDYGYQIAGFSDRTTLVDNNTWNNSKLCGADSEFTCA